MMRSFLPIPCLLICVACATPFPIQSLEEGMTDGTVRERFGAPEAIKTEPGGVESSWTYPNEEQDWFFTVISSTVFLPHCIFVTAVTMPFGAEHWCSLLPTVEEKPVVLHFEAEKLVRWEVIEPVPDVSSGYTYRDPFPSTMTFPSKKEAGHHRKGHKHHHGHGC